MRWSSAEESELHAGVAQFGEGHWAEILAARTFNPSRTNVDLKDKWRNVKSSGAVPSQSTAERIHSEVCMEIQRMARNAGHTAPQGPSTALPGYWPTTATPGQQTYLFDLPDELLYAVGRQLLRGNAVSAALRFAGVSKAASDRGLSAVRHMAEARRVAWVPGLTRNALGRQLRPSICVRGLQAVASSYHSILVGNVLPSTGRYSWTVHVDHRSRGSDVYIGACSADLPHGDGCAWGLLPAYAGPVNGPKHAVLHRFAWNKRRGLEETCDHLVFDSSEIGGWPNGHDAEFRTVCIPPGYLGVQMLFRYKVQCTLDADAGTLTCTFQSTFMPHAAPAWARVLSGLPRGRPLRPWVYVDTAGDAVSYESGPCLIEEEAGGVGQGATESAMPDWAAAMLADTEEEEEGEDDSH